LHIKQTLKSYGFAWVKIWWTEWGVSPSFFSPVNYSVFGAPFIHHGMKSAQGRANALAYWVSLLKKSSPSSAAKRGWRSHH